MKVHCEDCKWFTNAWGDFDCYEKGNNIYIDELGYFGVKGIKQHSWEINKNHNCKEYTKDESNNTTRDLMKLHKECGVEFKTGGNII